MKYYSHNKMKEVDKDFSPKLISELKSFFVERYVDNMSTEDLVEYVTTDMDRYVDSQFDEDFLNDAMDYWGDHFDEVVEEIEEFANCDFKKDRKEELN
tara:strand:+ start:451 stop:744 length:294 start_codon:yes stop_codon:yes gene_type:complete